MRLTKEIETHTTSLSPRADVMQHDGEDGRFIMDFCCYRERAVYREVAKAVAPVIAELMQSLTVRVYQDQLIIKEAGAQTWTTFWHADQPYYDIEGMQSCSIWIPVDYVPRESSLEFIAGSHMEGPFLPKAVSTGNVFFATDNKFKPVPDINEDRSAFDIRGWDAHPGDALLHNLQTLHGSPSGSVAGRRVFSIRFIGDDIRVVERDNKKVPTSLANNVNQSKDFPVVWPPDQITEE